MDKHELYMQRCNELALNGLGKVAPNPLVGAVLVHNDTIIGEGWHQQYGKAHAEINAIEEVYRSHPQAADLLKNAILYVNLEPCSHFGKTPPCAERILKEGIPKVVIACKDPFQQVDGKGIEMLRNGGIEVITGILRDEAEELNKRFFTFQLKRRPYIILKWAESHDGFFAPPAEKQSWITNDASRMLVHRWRSEEDAIFIGTRTASIDDPQLDVRLVKGKNPVRIVLDRELSLPPSLRLFQSSAKVLVFNESKTERKDHVQYLQTDFNEYLLPFILYQLYLMDIQSVIIEGGAFTIREFISRNLWDEARVFRGKEAFLEGIPAPNPDREPVVKMQISSDELAFYRNLG